MKNTNERILAVMAVVFELEAKDIPADAAPGTIEPWDSLRHLSLIVALEEEFRIRFTDDEMSDLLNRALIEKIVATKIGRP